MNELKNYLRDAGAAAVGGWDRFWFTPTDPATYCLIRVLAGTMLFYTHAVWTLEFDAFFGPHPWLAKNLARGIESGPYAWSHFFWIDSISLLWAIHLAALVVLAMFALGLWSRATSILAFLITVSYANRVPAAQFGLDNINGLLALYLMVGPSGACYSLDRWLADRKAAKLGRGGATQLTAVAKSTAATKSAGTAKSTGANIGIRLIQLHMCVIYLFAGLGKLKGDTWWDGTAMWFAVANYEYQSIDMTWIADWPLLAALLTHTAVWWEATYPALVWPRYTRPIVIALAVPLHLGIALFLGMMTFGLVMLIGNAAFISPRLVRAAVEWPWRRTSRAAATEGAPAETSPRPRRPTASSVT